MARAEGVRASRLLICFLREALAAQDVASKLTVMARSPHDLADWRSLFRPLQNYLVCLLPTQVSLILQPFCIGQKSGVNDGAAASIFLTCRMDLPTASRTLDLNFP